MSKTPKQQFNRSARNHRRSTRSGDKTEFSGGKTEFTEQQGILEMHTKGYGFLRQRDRGYEKTESDPFVSQSVARRHDLRQGNYIVGTAQDGRMVSITQIDERPVGKYVRASSLDRLIPTNPTRRLHLEYPGAPTSMRMLDLLCPIGFGQRALIAAPPRAGKTTLLQQIGHSITSNHPEAKTIALLVDERPEEIIDFQDDLPIEIFASSLDSEIANHVRQSRIALDRCHRLVEQGHDVVLLVDSLTRMTRAYNKLPGPSNMMGPGGLRIDAMQQPRKLFASARAFKEFEGSLTIIATVLIGTNNRMDEVIFREFKGTGNTDIVLDQDLADSNIWPALDLRQSATRRSEGLQDPTTHSAAKLLKRSLLSMSSADAIQSLTCKLDQFGSNDDFVSLIHQSTASRASVE